MWKSLETIGNYGSERGIIILDEESDLGARITLEQYSQYYAITAGIYGAIVHTVFCSQEVCKIRYQEMKDDIPQFYEYFTSKY